MEEITIVQIIQIIVGSFIFKAMILTSIAMIGFSKVLDKYEKDRKRQGSRKQRIIRERQIRIKREVV